MRSLRNTALVPEPVVGWRAWSVTESEEGLRLSSLTRTEGWVPGEPLRAVCDRRGHAAPNRWCSCGVYAGADPSDLAELGRIAGAAVGQVSLWGSVIEHAHGHRASEAYPARLRLVCVACLADGRGTTATRVDRDRSTARTRLVPQCDEHASDAALPASREIEQQLLATYQIDQLPDVALARIVRRPAAASRRGFVVAAVAVALLALIAGFSLIQLRSADPTTTGSATSARNVVFRRLNHGAVSPMTTGYRDHVPQPSLRCARARTRAVVHTTCRDPSARDPAANIVVGRVVSRRQGAAACGPRTIVATRAGRTVLCWWSKPSGAAGIDPISLKD
jgi:hypothetical protein